MSSAEKVTRGAGGDEAIAATRRAVRRSPAKRVAMMLAVIAVGVVISMAREAAAQVVDPWPGTGPAPATQPAPAAGPVPVARPVPAVQPAPAVQPVPVARPVSDEPPARPMGPQLPAPEPRTTSFLFRLGYDIGGEEVAMVRFSDGDSKTLTAGGGSSIAASTTRRAPPTAASR